MGSTNQDRQADVARHAREAVRAADYDRYLTVLYADAGDRDALFALYAFNLELARVRDAVSEPMLGEIRYAWWREAVEGLFKGIVRDHPVLRALAPHVAARALPNAPFETMIEARIADLYREGPMTVEAATAYMRQTASALSSLVFHVCGTEGGKGAVDVGLAWGLSGLIHALAEEGRAGTVDADLLRETMMALSGEGEAALARISGSVGARRALAAYLPAILVRDYLQRARKAGFEPSQIDPGKGKLQRQLKLLRAALSGRI